MHHFIPFAVTNQLHLDSDPGHHRGLQRNHVELQPSLLHWRPILCWRCLKQQNRHRSTTVHQPLDQATLLAKDLVLPRGRYPACHGARRRRHKRRTRLLRARPEEAQRAHLRRRRTRPFQRKLLPAAFALARQRWIHLWTKLVQLLRSLRAVSRSRPKDRQLESTLR